MGDNWLEIGDESIDAQEIERRIRERMCDRGDVVPIEGMGDPVDLAKATWREVIGVLVEASSLGERLSIWQQECDIVPRSYVIDWRTPILGPIHAFVRRIINAEIRRYLLPVLERQSYLNQKILQAFQDLTQENARLRREVERLQGMRE